jgi:hypothetical protein
MTDDKNGKKIWGKKMSGPVRRDMTRRKQSLSTDFQD